MDFFDDLVLLPYNSEMEKRNGLVIDMHPMEPIPNPYERIFQWMTRTSEEISALREEIDRLHQKLDSKGEFPELPDILNVNQASIVTGLSAQTIYEKKMKGTIPYMKVGGSIKFNKAELIKWSRKI